MDRKLCWHTFYLIRRITGFCAQARFSISDIGYSLMSFFSKISYNWYVLVFIHIVRLVCNGGASKIDMNDTLNYSNIVTDIDGEGATEGTVGIPVGVTGIAGRGGRAILGAQGMDGVGGNVVLGRAGPSGMGVMALVEYLALAVAAKVLLALLGEEEMLANCNRCLATKLMSKLEIDGSTIKDKRKECFAIVEKGMKVDILRLCYDILG
ncbi:hypothetical protein Cgig2_014140 [Carnegiea gigantea]|uniref:Uncharacterized protein n=1 Tax=Carnegiea gigantea TaxID=171969 RepID=A0A9Q1JM61_9CARY|nr:hypothetical protein Cgig2_014140 [Carnegiea gigantea]